MSAWKLARDVRFRRILDETVVVRQETSEVLGLNGVGGRILELLRDGRNESAMVDILAREFEVEPEVLRTDVREFVEELAADGVIEEAGE